ncbi:MAG: Uma2 family endonuclease [Anaerolineae bacterium]
MVLEVKRLTAEEFDVLAQQPENADKLLEFIGGAIVEVPSNAAASQYSSRISGYFFVHLLQNPTGHLTGEAGGYIVSGERYAPDVALISKTKQPELATQGYNSNPPDLAVEVDFPSTPQSQHDLTIKIHNYVAAGTVVWLVLPEKKTVEVYAPGQPMKPYRMGDTLNGGDVLPGFTLAVKDIFGE